MGRRKLDQEGGYGRVITLSPTSLARCNKLSLKYSKLIGGVPVPLKEIVENLIKVKFEEEFKGEGGLNDSK